MFVQRFDRHRVDTVGAFAVALLVFLAGCATKASTGGDDKAGGSADPVVLRLANTSFSLDRHPALQYFVDRIKEVSGGALRIDVAEGWGNNAADSEQQVVRDVAAGTIQLGSVGTHAFDTVGVSAFQALTAPMLIDNYPLQQAVLGSDIPAKMLAGLDKIGVVGIAVLGDGLRKPIAVDHPLLGPGDYRGITFGAFRSKDHADAIKALGATPDDEHGTEFDSGLRSGDIDGFEKGLNIVAINQSEYLAPYVTANVNLWPHTLALIANPRMMTGLTATQRGWLTKAGTDAASRSTDLTDNDAELVVELCAAGARFANASDTDLEALRQALTPVYATLNSDPTTKEFIDLINKLKQSTDPGPALEIPSGCTGRAAATPADAAVTTVATGPPSDVLDGTYRWTITKDDALAHGLPRDKEPENLANFPTTMTMTLTNGTMELRSRDGVADSGTYTVHGDQIVFAWIEGYESTYTFSVDDDGTLHLDPQLPIKDPGERFMISTEPWTKIADGGGPNTTEVAATLDGTYRWTITKDDALAHGTAGDKTPENLATFPWVFTMTMKDGTTHLKHRDGDGDTDDGSGTYSVNGDQITFSWPNGSPTETFSYSVDDDGTLHLVPVLPMDPGDQFVTATNPWTKIADGSGSGNAKPVATLGGTYRWTITKDDALAHGTPSDKTPEILATYPTTSTITMNNGTWHLVWRGDGVVKDEGSGSYTVDGDKVVFDWGNNPSLTFLFSIDADGTVHLDPQLPMAAGDQFIWATEPWAKIS